MKKSLLATTALAALGAATVAAPASAEGFELKIGGFMEQWFGYTDSSASAVDDSDAFGQHSDVEVHFSAKQTLDNGLTFGFQIESEQESDTGTNADEQYAYVEGSFGKLTIGSENTAPYLMHYAAKTNGIGVEEGDGPSAWAPGALTGLAATNVHGSSNMHNDNNNLTFISPRMNGIQIGASFVPDQGNTDTRSPNSTTRETDGNRDNGFGLAANYETSVADMSVKAAVGYSDAGTDKNVVGDNETFSGALQLGFGGFTASIAYGEHKKDDATAVNSSIVSTSLAYAAGPASVSLLYVRGEDTALNDKQDFFELGASYSVGPGVTARGSVYYWDTVDGGVNDAEGVAVAGGLVLSF
jgi:predicted porin